MSEQGSFIELTIQTKVKVYKAEDGKYTIKNDYISGEIPYDWEDILRGEKPEEEAPLPDVDQVIQDSATAIIQEAFKLVKYVKEIFHAN
jgi:hypothetical protein